MRFLRRPIILPKGATPRRLAAAKRRLQRHRDSWALFPQYWPKQTAEEDIADIDEKSLRGQLETRMRRAAGWRSVRVRIRTHPQKEQILRYWQTCNYPADPDTLSSLLTRLEKDPSFIETQERLIARAREMGRLMQELADDEPSQKEGENYRDAFFRRLTQTRKRAESERPDLFIQPRKE